MDEQAFYDRNLLKHEVLEKALSHVPFLGWKDQIIAEALAELNQDPSWGWRLFPEGVRDLLEFWSHHLDDQMLQILNESDVSFLKVREKIALGVKTRLEILTPYHEATRLASYYFLRPQQTVLALRLSAKTVDDIWHWAGDTSTDYNYYTKRLLLGGVYTSTLAYWMKDDSEVHEKTWKFLAHRIENVLTLPTLPQKARACAKSLVHRLSEVASALRP